MKFKWLLLLLCCFGVGGCSDNRPDAAAAAHIYNGSDVLANVTIKAGQREPVEFSVAPKSGVFVPLRKADRYGVEVVSPPELSAYSASVLVQPEDKTDTLFDIEGINTFVLYPTYHVPKSMTASEAHSEVERIKKLGKHQAYQMNEPAKVHTIPRGVYYTFSDEVEDLSSLTTPGRKVEIRYKVAAVE